MISGNGYLQKIEITRRQFFCTRWNFEKFLINPNGQPVRRYDQHLDPKEIIPDINDLLKTIKPEPEKYGEKKKYGRKFKRRN